jgi:pimeloyl-ACP methyl ester carboxylesterase
MPRVLNHKGCLLSYTVRGEGPPVLFIQGVGVHASGWTRQIDALAARFTCVAFDNRGLGLSQPRGCPITVPQMADDALAIMDALGWHAAHVVGHSLGGLIAMHLARTARRRVASLALLCTFARGKAATPLSPWVLWTGLRTRIGTRRQRRFAFLRLVMPPAVLAGADRDALADELAPIFGHDLGVEPPVTMAQLRAMRAYDATPHLSEFADLPTLVVSAAHDRIAAAAVGRAFAARIPGARYVELANAAHGATIQCADAVNALLLEHFSGQRVQGARYTGDQTLGVNEPLAPVVSTTHD